MPRLSLRRSGTGRLAAVLAVASVAAGCERRPEVVTADEIGARSVTLTLPSCEPAPPAGIDTIASGLEVPWDVAFLPDGRAVITERPGRLRLVSADGELAAEPLAVLPAYSPEGSEIGLMGVDAAPDGRSVYVTATMGPSEGGGLSRLTGAIGRRVARGGDPDRGHVVTLSILEVPVHAGSAEVEEVVTGLAAGFLHGGGAIRFGPDGMLYVTNGDALDHWWAQDRGSVRGKILRFDPTGDVPDDNPTPGSPVYAIGLRHSQGLAWHPDSGAMLAIDHGPTGLPTEDGRVLGDELNVVRPGANLGWPIVSGASVGGGLTSPIVEFPSVLAPAGLALYEGSTTAWHLDAFVTGLRGVSLQRIELSWEGAETTAVCREVLLEGTHGRFRMVRQAPDGTLWVGTSNRDGRGSPAARDDHLLRLHPPPSARADSETATSSPTR